MAASRITYEIVNKEPGSYRVLRTVNGVSSVLMRPGSTTRPMVHTEDRKAKLACTLAIEKDRAACTRLGLSFETDQYTYITIG
jgi:hypothetical protein